MKQTFGYQNKSYCIDLAPSGKTYTAAFGDTTASVELIRTEGERIDLLINGLPTSAYVSRDGTKRWVTVNGQTLVLTNSNETRKSSGPGLQLADQVIAQMPGLVRMVTVSNGNRVTKGQTLAVIEAMKMEIKVAAPFDGLVKNIKIKVGQTVEREQVLVELTRTAGTDTQPNP